MERTSLKYKRNLTPSRRTSIITFSSHSSHHITIVGMDPNRDRDQDDHTKPGIPRPGKQPDQQQQPNAPEQPASNPLGRSSQWIPPTTGNPDLDPAGLTTGQTIDLRERNPLTPQGMLYDPRHLLDQQRRSPPDYSGQVPPGARFDPFGPPDPSQVGPGRGPRPGHEFGMPDPDHLPPPGVPQQQPRPGGKSLKNPWGGPGFPPSGGAGGPPFL